MKTLGALIAIALVATLSGCAGAASPVPSRTNAGPSVAPTPSTTSTPVAVSAPSPTQRFDLGCNDFFPSATLAGLFSDTLVPQTPAQIAADQPGLSTVSGVQQAGGLYCSWTNGKPHYTSTGGNGGGQATYLTIYPDAAARWKYEADYNGISHNLQQYCSTDPTMCFLNAMRDGYVVSVYMDQIKLAAPTPGDDGISAPPAAVKKLFAHILSLLAAVGAPDPAWHPATPAAPSPAKCESYVTPKQLQAALKVRKPVDIVLPDGGAPFFGEGAINGCAFAMGGTEYQYGAVSWLHEGSALLRKAIDERTTPATKPLKIAGLGNGEWATIGRDRKVLYVDLSIDGNWIELSFVGPQKYRDNPGAAEKDYARAIAKDVVANLHRLADR